MTISEKIILYCNRSKIDLKDFAESVEISKSMLNHMLRGSSRWTLDVLKLIRKKYPDIDLNKLLDDDTSDFVVQEAPGIYNSENKLIKRMAEDFKKIYELSKVYSDNDTKKTQ